MSAVVVESNGKPSSAALTNFKAHSTVCVGEELFGFSSTPSHRAGYHGINAMVAPSDITQWLHVVHANCLCAASERRKKGEMSCGEN